MQLCSENLIPGQNPSVGLHTEYSISLKSRLYSLTLLKYEVQAVFTCVQLQDLTCYDLYCYLQLFSTLLPTVSSFHTKFW
jgi:hypothetical protein